MSPVPIARRSFLAGAAALGVSPALPALAAYRPPVEEIAFDPDIPALGNPDGDVTVVNFIDYQCPYCKMSYLDLGPLLAEDGGLRLVIKDWPILGDASAEAARLALAAHGQGKYAEAVHALMTASTRLGGHRTETLLGAAGIDVGRARHDLAARGAALDALLARNDAQAKGFALRGTPAFIIGATLYKRRLDGPQLRQAVEQARRV